MPADAGNCFDFQHAGNGNTPPLAHGLRGDADCFGELLSRTHSPDGSFESVFHASLKHGLTLKSSYASLTN